MIGTVKDFWVCPAANDNAPDVAPKSLPATGVSPVLAAYMEPAETGRCGVAPHGVGTEHGAGAGGVVIEQAEHEAVQDAERVVNAL